MNSSHIREHLLFALRRILRSLSHLMIRVGIDFDDFANLAQEVYVESAIRGLDHPGTPSRERIAMLTGLTRRQVDNCVDSENAAPAADPTLMSLAVEVLHKWHTTPEYAGPYGIPLEVQFDAPGDHCFRSLVALVDPEISPRVVLDELLRTGAVARAGNKHFRTTDRYFLMRESMSPPQIEYFGMTLSRLAATLEYNMNASHAEDRWLARRVIADEGLPVGLVPAFQQYARGKAIDFLLELDNWIALRASDSLDLSDRVDTGLNIFLFVEPRAKEPPLADIASGAES